MRVFPHKVAVVHGSLCYSYTALKDRGATETIQEKVLRERLKAE